MNTKLLAAVAFAVAASVDASRANAATIGKLYEWCTSQEAGMDQICAMYIIGFNDGFGAGQITQAILLGGKETPVYCPPENTNYKTSVAIFVSWAGRNRSRWDQDAPFGIIAAYRESWPCSAK